MLLTVGETENDVCALRKEFVSLGYFTYSATVDEAASLARKYPLTDLVIRAHSITGEIVATVDAIRSLYPSIHLFLLSDDKDHALDPRRQMPYDMDAYEVLFQILYYGEPSPNSVEDFRENLLIGGMLFNTYKAEVLIYGWRVPFPKSDVFLLRYLGEIYPRRATREELAELCFDYGKRASLAAVKTRISRLNARATELFPPLSRPVITYKKDEGGYQIDF